ncbi:MAG: cobalt ECF transporter T component CbiQ [Chthoniobacteraceae bacterium]
MSLLSEIFSDLFAREENVLSRMDPRTKLVVAFSALIAIAFSREPLFPLMTALACLAGIAAVGVPLRIALPRLAAPLGIASVLLAWQALLTGQTPLWSLSAGGFTLTVTREGLQHGIPLACRVVGGVSVLMLLSFTTPMPRVFCAMRSMGVPQGWVEIALLMYRYIFVLLELAGDVTAAQKVRLGYAGLRRGLASAGVLGGTLLLRSVDQAVRTDEAMRVRGYHGEIPLGALPRLPGRDAWTLAGALAVLAVAFFASEALHP